VGTRVLRPNPERCKHFEDWNLEQILNGSLLLGLKGGGSVPSDGGDDVCVYQPVDLGIVNALECPWLQRCRNTLSIRIRRTPFVIDLSFVMDLRSFLIDQHCAGVVMEIPCGE
jgi:hypothetical protein